MCSDFNSDSESRSTVLVKNVRRMPKKIFRDKTLGFSECSGTILLLNEESVAETKLNIFEKLSETEKQQINDLINEYRDVFAHSPKGVETDPYSESLNQTTQ